MEAAPPRDPCAARDLGRRGPRFAFPNEGQHRLDDGFARALAACLAAVQLGVWRRLSFHRGPCRYYEGRQANAIVVVGYLHLMVHILQMSGRMTIQLQKVSTDRES